ncbi:hypothetical protein ACFV9P_27425 [Streptomyces sp. NPDC059892]|uniref:hypothetical protein n=1 Tax=Streptomyces sp. NPDC059892 TaxID=3346989 RepID=UPI00364F717B
MTSNITVANRAIGGRSSRSFIEQGRLAAIHDVIKPGATSSYSGEVRPSAG